MLITGCILLFPQIDWAFFRVHVLPPMKQEELCREAIRICDTAS